MVFVFIVVATPCFVTGWGVSNITWVRKPSRRGGTRIKRVEHFKKKLQVLGIKILERKECDKKYKKFRRTQMGLDHLCAGAKALNKSPCNVRGYSLITSHNSGNFQTLSSPPECLNAPHLIP